MYPPQTKPCIFVVENSSLRPETATRLTKQTRLISELLSDAIAMGRTRRNVGQGVYRHRSRCRPLQGVPCIVHSIQYNVCCIQYNVCCMLHRVQYMLYAVHSTRYAVCCIQYNVYSMLYTVQCMLYAVHSTMYAVCYTQYNVCCMLYRVQCMLYAA